MNTTTGITRLRKSAGLTVLALMLAGAGLGLGAGIAQAQPTHPRPHPVLVRHDLDRFVDRHFPNSPLDRFLDRLFRD
ncbi:hypothetical protein BTO20_23210 [Mycobacterium dioxanotrophicus]|jgi:hypothetical protein|uniref:Uncharacterized protein n=1 Tax=Mycobacterium dioxanotrophicus TaxID=482462 RepID=A0A1Y0C7H5_9MYCO|nr:hypothetical protein [Mycobacterium dioxanotrophicus]ART71062.1 hypothetical protein BTO20_23210 [Mycobacterium dioxanotrophicus]